MKTPITAALALPFLLIASSLNASAQGAQHMVVIKEIETTIQKTPQFSVSGVRDKRVDPRDWFEIEAELDVKTDEKANPSGFVPELRVQWYAIVVDKYAKDANNRTRMLTGDVDFQNIRAKRDSVFVSAYITPDTLEKLTGQEKLQESDIKAVALVITGSGLSSRSVTEKAIGVGSDKKWWESTKYAKLNDAIVAKSKTPFAPLWSDRYPTEKPEK